MQVWTWTLSAAALGLLSGAGIGVWEFRGELGGDPLRAGEVALRPENLPRAVVLGGSEFDFGQMELGETGEHTFELRNLGSGTLELEAGKPSCKCTVSQLSKRVLQPNESALVTLNWTSTEYALEFSQTAPILTNDPLNSEISLRVFGQVTQTVIASPADLSLGDLRVNDSRTAQIKLLAFKHRELALESATIQDEAYADFFEFDWRPLRTEELVQQASAGLLVTIRVQPGLSAGGLQTAAIFKTDLEGVPPLQVPIFGRVGGDISLAGSTRFDREQNILKLNAVDRADGAKETLLISVRGDEDVEIDVESVEPAQSLTAEVIRNRRPGQGASRAGGWKLVIRVPPGSPTVNRLGSREDDGRISLRDFGRVVLKTTHPSTPQITVYVRFAVR